MPNRVLTEQRLTEDKRFNLSSADVKALLLGNGHSLERPSLWDHRKAARLSMLYTILKGKAFIDSSKLIPLPAPQPPRAKEEDTPDDPLKSSAALGPVVLPPHHPKIVERLAGETSDSKHSGHWWLFPCVWGSGENVRQFIPRLHFFFLFFWSED